MSHLNKKAIWQRPDGGISVTHFDDRDKFPNETDNDFITRYTNKLKLDPVFKDSFLTIIDATGIPLEDSQRNEWSLKGLVVEVDPVKVQIEESRKSDRKKILLKMGITEGEFKKLFNRDFR